VAGQRKRPPELRGLHGLADPRGHLVGFMTGEDVILASSPWKNGSAADV
jgi:hypothetical protein